MATTKTSRKAATKSSVSVKEEGEPVAVVTMDQPVTEPEVRVPAEAGGEDQLVPDQSENGQGETPPGLDSGDQGDSAPTPEDEPGEGAAGEALALVFTEDEAKKIAELDAAIEAQEQAIKAQETVIESAKAVLALKKAQGERAKHLTYIAEQEKALVKEQAKLKTLDERKGKRVAAAEKRAKAKAEKEAKAATALVLAGEAQLTPAEQVRLTELEDDLSNQLLTGSAAYLRSAEILDTIERENLAKSYKGGFKAYALGKWNIDRKQIDRMRMLVRVREQVALRMAPTDEAGVPQLEGVTLILPRTESQTRELNRAGGAEDQSAAWAEVLKRAENDESRITAALIKTVVDEMFHGGGQARTEANVQKRVAAIEAAESFAPSTVRPAVLNFNRVIEYAYYHDHVFALQTTVTLAASGKNKAETVYEVFVDNVPDPKPYTTYKEARVRLEQIAAERDEAEGKPAEVQGEAEVEAESTDQFYAGLDSDTNKWESFSLKMDDETDTAELGYKEVKGPFATLEEAMAAAGLTGDE